MTAIDTGRWYREMLRDGRLLSRTKLVLVVLADRMDLRGYVSIPRSRIAEYLGVVPRRITEGIKEAKEAGWLDVVTAGRPGVTAVYVATIPSAAARDGAPIRPNKRQRDSAYIRTKRADDMGLSTAPSDGADGGALGHAQDGAPIQPPSSTSATSPTSASSEAKPAHAGKRSSTADISRFDSSRSARSGDPARPDAALDPLAHDVDAVLLDGKVALAPPRQPLPADDVQDAHDLLIGLGPERYEAALRRAADADPDLEGPALMVAAAALVRGAA